MKTQSHLSCLRFVGCMPEHWMLIEELEEQFGVMQVAVGYSADWYTKSADGRHLKINDTGKREWANHDAYGWPDDGSTEGRNMALMEICGRADAIESLIAEIYEQDWQCADAIIKEARLINAAATALIEEE